MPFLVRQWGQVVWETFVRCVYLLGCCNPLAAYITAYEYVRTYRPSMLKAFFQMSVNFVDFHDIHIGSQNRYDLKVKPTWIPLRASTYMSGYPQYDDKLAM